MPEIAELSDPDFTAQMQGLVHQAEQAIGSREAAAKQAETQKEAEEKALKSYQSLPQMLKPLQVGLEAVGRATLENKQLLQKMEETAATASKAQQDLPTLVTELRGIIEQKNAVSREMFDALHAELKGYKDDFFLETVHRPLIRDLITLYDDLSEIRRQAREAVEAIALLENASAVGQRLRDFETHLAHHLDFVLEVLARLEVSQMPIGEGVLDKRAQRAMAVEQAETQEEDLQIVRTLKRGFLWKDRIVRAEEVVIKKWKEGFLAAPPSTQ